MVNRSRATGTRAETALVAVCPGVGFPNAHRLALHGAQDVGDVWLAPRLIASVKAARGLDLSGWVDDLDEMIRRAHADAGVLVVKRRGRGDPLDWYAVQRFGPWAASMSQHINSSTSLGGSQDVRTIAHGES